MSLTPTLPPAYTRTLPMTRRRTLAAGLGLSVLGLQLFLPSLDAEHWGGLWPLLLVPVAAVCLHGLTSQAWVWTQLFRREAQLDEYERHTRDAFVARAFTLSGRLLWVSFLATLLGGGLITRFPALNPFAGASTEVAWGLFVLVAAAGYDGLPRILAALHEDLPEE